jgi:LysM repeat protein
VSAAQGSPAGRTATSSRVGLRALNGGSRRHLGRAGRRQLRRRRLAGLLRFVVFLLLIFVAVWAGVRVAHAGTDASVYTGHQYVVRSGDTLWDIAAREYGAGADLRHAVFAIGEANHLDQSSVQPGEHLTLPYLEE